MKNPNLTEVGEIITKAMVKAGYEPIGKDDKPMVREAEGEVDIMFHKEDELPIVVRCIDILTLLVGSVDEDEKEKVEA